MSKAKEIYDSMMAKDYATQWLGAELVHLEEGKCTLQMLVKREMLNGFGTLHGGMAYSLADSALAFAVNSYGLISPLINGSMSYAKGAIEGDVLRAEAKVISLGNKKADIDVVITCKGHEEPFYFFRGTVYRTSKEHEI